MQPALEEAGLRSSFEVDEAPDATAPSSSVDGVPRTETMPARVLVALDTSASWSRGVLRGFATIAREYGWAVLRYAPGVDLASLTKQWEPAALVVGRDLPERLPNFGRPVVSVNADRTAQGVASVVPDETHIAGLAVRHLFARRLEHLTSFRGHASPFAVAREHAFEALALREDAHLVAGFRPAAPEASALEERARLVAWLRALPLPCGVLACSDLEARRVARYALAAGLRIPKDVALVGVDNDAFECELTAPSLTSVAVPWRTLGSEAARLVALALAGTDVRDRRVVVPPVDVVARRSSDVLAIDDALVADAVAWIGSHALERLSVPMVARAVSSGRQRLERRFRVSLGRTVGAEVRRARVETAKNVLRSTDLELCHVAKQSGFKTAALLNEAFRRELGMTPGVYRRRMRAALDEDL